MHRLRRVAPLAAVLVIACDRGEGNVPHRRDEPGEVPPLFAGRGIPGTEPAAPVAAGASDTSHADSLGVLEPRHAYPWP